MGITIKGSTGSNIRFVDNGGGGSLVVSSGGGGGGIQPDSLPGLVGWWKADALTGLSNGQTVSSWADSSGTGNDLSAVDEYGGAYSSAVYYTASDPADRKSTRLNSSHVSESRMPSSA